MKYGFVRVACATPKVRIADCDYNAKEIIALLEEAEQQNVSVIAFPELAVTGYTCGNLFLNEQLQREQMLALGTILERTRDCEALILVGVAIPVDSKLYNCAAVISKGKILGIVPKKYIPNYSQYTELRYFAKGKNKGTVDVLGQKVPFGIDLIFVHEKYQKLQVAAEICEDLWVPNSHTNNLAKAGSTLIVNLSASDEKVGKADKRRMFLRSQSERLSAAYLYANAGEGESSTDLVYSGHNIVAENGKIIAESQPFTTGLLVADIDIDLVTSHRQRVNTFKSKEYGRKIFFDCSFKNDDIIRKVPENPFIEPGCDEDKFYDDLIELQAQGLMTRLRNTGFNRVVIGVSGGLDSTLALLVAVRAFEKLQFCKKDILCVFMPGFGTSRITSENSRRLIDILGVQYREIPINESLIQHFEDIGKDINDQDLVYENAQARERTQILMDLANMNNALVIGTGDLSEIALGFSTYNGDHMSMYNVNCGVPKTIIRNMIMNMAEKSENREFAEILFGIGNTPISPELLPTSSNEPIQKTEDIIGPYELHDFFMYYFLKYGFGTEKILVLAKKAFSKKYQDQYIADCLNIFFSRFFKNQFKRSCQPDGPKVLDISLSPRNFFMLPSDRGRVAAQDVAAKQG